MDKIRYIDLFCGIGGFHLGMEAQGFECVFSSAIDEECRKTYTANFGISPSGDITKISADEIPDHEILCAGFPYQPFSISGKQKGFSDVRGTLFFDICRILAEKKPKVVFLENVKHLIHHDGGRTLSVIINKLTSLGYTVSYSILNSADFGVPQNRERIIIIGVLYGAFDFNLVQSTPRRCLTEFLDTGNNFKYLENSEYTLLESPKQQEKSGLIFAGYLNKATRKTGVREGTEHLSRAHKQPNRIYSVLGTNPTLSAQETSGRYYILDTNKRVRKLTLNECWKLMGFPETFIKCSSKSEQYRQLGNSVCVPMITAIAQEIKNQVF